MRRRRFTGRESLTILKRHEAGRSFVDPSRKHGIIDQTLSQGTIKRGDLDRSEASRSTGLEDEGRRLKAVLAET